jgi:RNA polymerase sigma factor (sigma-70 family)
MTDPADVARGRLANVAEAAVIALAAAGDDAAFSELVRRRQSSLRQLLRRLCRDASLADDLAQQAFLAAWRSLPKLASPAAFWPWIRRVGINAWLQHLRARRQSLAVGDEDLEGLPAPATSIEERLDLDAALAQLPAAQRLCTVLAYGEGMSHVEIAEATGLPLGTVKSHIKRGAARLRQRLSAYAPTGGPHDQ